MWTAAPILLVAIVAEVGATAALPRAQSFRDPFWSVVVLGGYAVSIWLLAVVVKYMDISAVYAIWAGVGTAAIAVIGVVAFGERLDLVKGLALAMIVAGVVLLNLHGAHGTASGTAVHDGRASVPSEG